LDPKEVRCRFFDADLRKRDVVELILDGLEDHRIGCLVDESVLAQVFLDVKEITQPDVVFG
jgi:hypothetical protein